MSIQKIRRKGGRPVYKVRWVDENGQHGAARAPTTCATRS